MFSKKPLKKWLYSATHARLAKPSVREVAGYPRRRDAAADGRRDQVA
jgi:hypothetical protein